MTVGKTRMDGVKRNKERKTNRKNKREDFIMVVLGLIINDV